MKMLNHLLNYRMIKDVVISCKGKGKVWSHMVGGGGEEMLTRHTNIEIGVKPTTRRLE